MKYAILAALALSSCQTIKINGVEIKPGEQAKWGLLAAVVVAGAYYLTQDSDDDALCTGDAVPIKAAVGSECAIILPADEEIIQ